MLLINRRGLLDEAYMDHLGGLGGYDYQNLPELGVQMASTDKQDLTHTAIRIVYGATEQMPFRGLSYILPGLVFMENLQKTGVRLPQLQVIFANNISSRLDYLDINVSREQAQRLTLVAKSYVQTFFPDIAGSVVFLEDMPLEKGSVIRNELINVRSVLKDKLSTDLESALREKGKNNGGFRTSSFYCAAHPLFHDADLEGSLKPLIDDQAQAVRPDAIISIGGHQEKDFYRLRHALKPHLGPSYQKKTIQFFTKHYVPPYYKDRMGEPSLDEVLSGEDPSPDGEAAKHDIVYFYQTSSSRGDVYEFLDRQRGRNLI